MDPILVNTMLTVFALAYIFSGCIFMNKQKQGASLDASFDKAIVGGGCFFALGSGMSSVAIMYGTFQPYLL